MSYLLLALPILVPDLRLQYPGALPGMVQQTLEYSMLASKVSLDAVPSVSALGVASNDVVVLVIGESSSPDYWQLAGAAEKTTPQLSARKDRGELVYFEKHMSAATVTFVAVPNLLTPFGNLVSAMSPNTAPSILSLMNKAGRRTGWLSTQSPQDASAEATDKEFKGGYFSFLTAGNLDEVLLPRADAWLKLHSSEPSFLVVHTQGSHIPFELRYPPQFKRWAIPGGSFPVSQSEGNYRNTVLYTDYVLDQLIGRLEREPRPALLAYVSDHGETVMRTGHVVRTADMLSLAALRVPFFVWANQSWRDAHPQEWAQLLRIAASKAVTHHLNISPTLMHLAGLTYDRKPEALDLLSPGSVPWTGIPVIKATDKSGGTLPLF